MSKSKNFIDQYQILEKKLKKIARSKDGARLADIVSNVCNKNKFLESKRSLLYDLNALRGVFSHQKRDRYIAEVNDLAITEVTKILEILDNPPKVGDVFKTDMFVARMDDNVDYILREMQKNIYTHIPVYDNCNNYIGTFTETSLLDWLVDFIKDGHAYFNKTKMSDVKHKYLHSKINRVAFIKPEKSIFEIEKMFEDVVKKEQRLGAIFITKDGKEHGELPIGIITAWDLYRIKEYL